MRKLPFLMLSVVGACAALYACGSSSGDDDDGIIPFDAGPDVPIVFDTGVDGPAAAAGMGKAFCDATLGQIQNAIGQCCSPAEKGGFTDDTYKNIDALVTACETTLEHSIALRRTAPNTANYAACENAFKTTFAVPPATGACQGLDAYRDTDVLSPSCAGAFAGTGVANSACAGSFDCQSGLVCVGYGPTNDGTCLTPVPADGTCGISAGSTAIPVDIVIPTSNQCASGLYCSDNTSCKPQYGDDGGPDGGCTNDFECTSGKCLDTHCGSSGTVTPYCATDVDCAPGSYCDVTQPSPDDGGAPPGAVGTCAASKINAQTCTTGSAHECQGKCGSGPVCASLCSFP